jgi:hypothetical protein
MAYLVLHESEAIEIEVIDNHNEKIDYILDNYDMSDPSAVELFEIVQNNPQCVIVPMQVIK